MAKPSSRKQPFLYSYEKTLRALFDLSHPRPNLNVEEIVSLIINAPDPETARQAVASCIDIESDVLGRKWQQTIIETWSECHPKVPHLPEVTLTEEEVGHVSVIRDAIEVAKELNREPAKLVVEHGHQVLVPEDAIRLALVMPSWQGVPDMNVEHETAIYPIWRLRQLLQQIGLIRPLKGELRVVKSRYSRFLSLPKVQQFYILWHTDVYHLNWTSFAPQWKRYIELVQGYLPLLWDMHSEIEAGYEEDGHTWTEDALDMFLTVWEQEGVVRQNNTIMGLYKNMTIPAVVKKLIFDDLFVRYRLLEPQYDKITALLRGENSDQAYIWTTLGEKIIHAERLKDLPCGIDLVK